MTDYYVDAELAMAGWLSGKIPERVCTDLPADLQGAITASGGVVQVTRISGAAATFTLDRATLDFDCYAADRATARALAYKVFGILRYELAGSNVTGGRVSAVKPVMAPINLPHDGQYARRFGCTVQIITHT